MIKILINTPKLQISGGVSSYWISLLSEFEKYNDLNMKHLEIGGHGKNLFGSLLDQYKMHNTLKSDMDLAFLNPSLASRSFFRDGLFAKQLIDKEIPFIVFFHGWNYNFEKKIDKKYIKFFLNSFGNAKKIFVLSEYFKNKILEWGYKGEVIVKITTVDSKLLNDFTIDKKIKTIHSAKTIKILFLARLVKEKGIYELIDAFTNLHNRYSNIELTIAGDGEELERIKQITEDIENIKIIGHIEGEEKIAYLKNSHIYCLPSYAEGLPISVLEALAFGLPVITTKVGGLADFFQDKKMGYFVKPKEIKELEDKLEILILDRKKIVEIGKFNHQYSKEKLLDNIVANEIYIDILSIIKLYQEEI